MEALKQPSFSGCKPTVRDTTAAKTLEVPGISQLQVGLHMTCQGELLTTRQQTKVRILVDTGNSLESCAAISKQKADELGLEIAPSTFTIGKASNNYSMITCGIIDNLKLRFGGHTDLVPK